MPSIGVGIVGAGYGARVILPCLSAVPGMRVLALCARHPEAARARAAGFPVGRFPGSLDDLLGIEGLGLVCLAVPPALHLDMARKVLAAGKTLLCEKPLALDSRQARAIVRAAGNGPRQHLVDHQLRFHPNNLKVKSLLDQGAIGEVRFVELSYIVNTRVDPGLAWDWWSDRAQGGGQLLALGSHLVDLLRWWLGEVESVSGTLATFMGRRSDPVTGRLRAVTSDDFISAHLRFKGGPVAGVTTSSMAPDHPGLRVRISGTRGVLLMEGQDRLFLSGRRGGSRDVSQADDLAGKPVIGLNAWRTSLVRLGRSLVRSAREGSLREGATLVDGLRNQEVLDAIRASAAEGRAVVVPGGGPR
ncbi:MAG: Gfo/Idh/MocA family oxidoreductase [Elusimicrobiota bacterium]|jgi:predicted dehydrogenase